MGKRRGLRDFIIILLALFGTVLVIFGRESTILAIIGTLSIILSVVISLSRFLLKWEIKMNGFSEIPKYVRYDFLITFIAIILISSAWYFTNINEIPKENTNIFYLIGIPLAIWGFGEMYNNYREGRDLKQLQTIVEKTEIYEKLAKNRILDS